MTKTSNKPARKTLSLKKAVPVPEAKAEPASKPATTEPTDPVRELVADAPAPVEPIIEKTEPAVESTTAPAPAKPNANAHPRKSVYQQQAEPKTAAPKKPAKVGKCTTIYAAALKRPHLTGKAFADMLIAEGLQSSGDTILTIRSDVVRVLNFLDEQGLLKSPFKQA